MDRNVTVIIAASDRTAARDLIGDQGAFSVPLNPQAGWTDPVQPTHYMMSGFNPEASVVLMESSVSPMFNVTDNEGTTPHAIIASRTPALYMKTEEL